LHGISSERGLIKWLASICPLAGEA